MARHRAGVRQESGHHLGAGAAVGQDLTARPAGTGRSPRHPWSPRRAGLPHDRSRGRAGAGRCHERPRPLSPTPKIGALSLGQGVWAVPEVPVFADGVRRALELTDRTGDQGITLRAADRSEDDAVRFRELFRAARSADRTVNG
ncbi:Chromate resistance protein ChrB [Streptomyces roseolus]|uniref:Chromate resistance protein ChrB n=1 Tax=Streptomyces roseolus TaxID=67358 RepID=UPI0037B5A982